MYNYQNMPLWCRMNGNSFVCNLGKTTSAAKEKDKNGDPKALWSHLINYTCLTFKACYLQYYTRGIVRGAYVATRFWVIRQTNLARLNVLFRSRFAIITEVTMIDHTVKRFRIACKRRSSGGSSDFFLHRADCWPFRSVFYSFKHFCLIPSSYLAYT